MNRFMDKKTIIKLTIIKQKIQNNENCKQYYNEAAKKIY